MNGIPALTLHEHAEPGVYVVRSNGRFVCHVQRLGAVWQARVHRDAPWLGSFRSWQAAAVEVSR